MRKLILSWSEIVHFYANFWCPLQSRLSTHSLQIHTDWRSVCYDYMYEFSWVYLVRSRRYYDANAINNEASTTSKMVTKIFVFFSSARKWLCDFFRRRKKSCPGVPSAKKIQKKISPTKILFDFSRRRKKWHKIVKNDPNGNTGYPDTSWRHSYNRTRHRFLWRHEYVNSWRHE